MTPFLTFYLTKLSEILTHSRLRDEKQALQNEQASRQDLRTRLDEMMRFLNDLPCELTEYEEDYVRTLLEKITVYDDYFIVEFKSGIEIQIDE